MKHQPFGILVEGKLQSAYKEKEVPSWSASPDEEKETEQDSEISPISGKATPTKIIAYGCSNLFKSDVLQAVMSHKALLLNSVDALTLGDDLIHIRSKNIVARRIRETSSFTKVASKAFVVWFPPVVFIAIGIYLTIRRKVK